MTYPSNVVRITMFKEGQLTMWKVYFVGGKIKEYLAPQCKLSERILTEVLKQVM